MPVASILIVDSDRQTRERIARELRELGHDVRQTDDAGSALKAVATFQPDLMVCECALPDLAGIELLHDMRRDHELRTMRVLMTSSTNGADDLVRALDSGADDFVGKPINMNEFRARVDACLRRPASIGQSNEIRAGGVAIDNVSHRVSIDGKFVPLAPREYRLLQFLLNNQDRVFSRKQLLVHVWERDVAVGPRTVDVHIRRLRSMLEPFGYESYLQTVRGSGYRFSLES